MKFKVLKDFISSVLNGIEGKIHDMELDEPTAKMWTEHGLIEEVKEEKSAEVTTAESDSTVSLTKETAEATPTESETVSTDSAPATTETAAPIQVESAPTVTESAQEAVTADETK